jgi:hypothetical protein
MYNIKCNVKRKIIWHGCSSSKNISTEVYLYKPTCLQNYFVVVLV